jgi:hypothetical protein
VIEGVPQIISTVGNDSSAFQWNRSAELQLNNLIACSRIYLSDYSATVFFEETLLHGIEFHGVSLCSTDLLSGAVENHAEP